MAKILVIEDHKPLGDALIIALSKEYEVKLAESKQKAKKYLDEENFDLVILDLGLPDGHGFEICSYLKSKDSANSVQIIILSGEGNLDTKLTGLELGADDYLVKPFDQRELAARIKARLRKTPTVSKHRVGPFEINEKSQKIFITEGEKKRDLELTRYEYHLLVFFLDRLNQVFKRADLVKECFGEEYNISERSVDLHIFSIRKKMGEEHDFIKTIYGQGYSFQLSTDDTT